MEVSLAIPVQSTEPSIHQSVCNQIVSHNAR